MSQARIVGSSLYSTPVMLFLRKTMAVTKSRYAACTGARGKLQTCSGRFPMEHCSCSKGCQDTQIRNLRGPVLFKQA